MVELETRRHEPVPEGLPGAQESKGRMRTIIFGAGIGVVLVAVVAAAVLLLPGLLGGGFDRLGAASPTLSHPDGLTVSLVSGEDVRLRLGSLPRQVFLDGGGERDFSGALAALPSFLDLKSPLYLIDRRGEGVFNIEIAIPNNAEPYQTLDLYRWDPETGEWRFVPGHIDVSAGVIRTDEMPSNVAVFQTRGATPLLGTMLEEGQELSAEAASALNIVMPSGLVAQADGTIAGAPVGGWQPGAGYAVIPLVRGDGASLSAVLNNEASLALHIQDLLALVTSSGYTGIAVSYQGVNVADHAAFSGFIADLAAAFDSANKVVVVVLPRPAGNIGAWDTGGYDWRAIGAAADIVVLDAGNNPVDFSITGTATNLLIWAVGEISRYKIHVASSTFSFDETNNLPISYFDAVAALGNVALEPGLAPDVPAYEPGTDFLFDLSADISDVVFDPGTGAYAFTLGGDAAARRIWIVTASSVRSRLDLMASFNIGGMTLNDLAAPGNDGGMPQALSEFKVRNVSSLPSQLLMRWHLSDASGAALTETTGLATPWAWNAGFPGSYTIQGVLVGSREIERGEVSFQVEAPGVEVEETPSLTPTTTPTRTPTTPTVTTTPTPSTTAPPPVAVAGWNAPTALGGQVPGFIAHPGEMQSAGMTWVKFQLKWSPGANPGEAAGMINAGRANGFKVLLSISGPAYPTSIDFASYVEFVRAVAAYQPDAIEVYNEMNLDREWPAGQIDPASYVNNMLAPSFNAIKSVSPGTKVIIGALAPTGFDNEINAWSDQRYVQGLAAAGAAQYADCIGAHHNSGTTSPSVQSGRPEGDHYSWYFLPTISVYFYGMGGTLPVCLTEFGYLTPEGISEPLPDIFAWGAGNTLAEHAAWLGEGVQIARGLGYIPLVIIWNVDFTNWGTYDPFKAYAIIRPDGTCPACQTLAAAMQ